MHLILLLLLSSCSLFVSGPKIESAKDSTYKLNFISPSWISKIDERSDYIFVNKEDGRILLSNSFCKEFQEGPLEDLAKKTFKTIKGFKVIEGSYIAFHEREAYRLIGEGKVDGVPVGLKIINTRRNNCYFDFVAISPISANQTASDFEAFLKSVVFK